MDFWTIFWIAVAAVVLISLFAWFFPGLFVARYMYYHLLVRTEPEKWGRVCSLKDDPEQVAMYEQGLQWGEAHEHQRRSVSIENEGFKLAGEFFDLGYKRTVILVPGRMEACMYSYFFAAPFEKAGFNILAIDNRSHGLSEGKYNSLGLLEYHDILAWAKFAHEDLSQEKILLFGICIGSAGCLYALCKDGPAPSYVMGMVADGMFASFYESLLNHLIVDKRPKYPFMWCMVFWMWVHCGVNFALNGPIKYINRLDRPILFIYTRQDLYSKPDQAERLYAKCHAPKRLAWFEKGGHSHIRINTPEQYDEAIGAFVKDFLG